MVFKWFKKKKNKKTDVPDRHIADHASRDHRKQFSATDLLARTFEDHGLKASVRGDWVVLGPDFPAIQAHFHDQGPNAASLLEISLFVPGSGMLIEGFAGLGSSGQDRLHDAFVNFQANSLHVLLSAFYGTTEEGQVEIERMETETGTWEWHLGPLGFRDYGGGANPSPDVPDGLLDTIRQTLRGHQPTHGETHWVRCFHCERGSDTPSIEEFLIDNVICPDGQDALSELTWQRRQAPYSVRHFAVLHKLPKQKTQHPEIATMAEALAVMSADEDLPQDVAEALIAQGYDSEMAERLTLFAPIAFFEASFPQVTIPDTYQLHDGESIVGQYRLSAEPTYAIARLLGHRWARDPDRRRGVFAVASMSGYMQALNEAAHQGHSLDRIEDFEFGESIVYR